MKKYNAPKGCPGVTLLGQFYATEADGTVTVPDMPNDLEANGFTEYVAPAPRKSTLSKEE